MTTVPLRSREEDRLAAVRALRILDTPREEVFDRIARLAAQLACTPMAAVSLVDRDRVWFKSGVGFEAAEIPRDNAFCNRAIQGAEPFTVLDAATDKAFRDNPQVVGDPGIRFYCAVPLIDESGNALGALCVMDHTPREAVSDWTLQALGMLTTTIYETLLKPRSMIAAKDAELSVLHAAIEATSDGIALTDADGIFTYMNAAHAAMFGFVDRRMVIGRSWRVLYDPVEQARVESEALPSLGVLGHWRGELTGRKADGSSLPQEVNLTALSAGGLICTTRDISVRKRIEQENRRLESELMERHKMEALGTLAGGLAHEINTPTQYIGDNIDFLKDGMRTLADFLGQFRAMATARGDAAAEALLAKARAADLDYLMEESVQAIAQCSTGIGRIRDLVSAIKRFSHPGDEVLAPNDLKAAIDLAVSLTVNQWKYSAELDIVIPPDLPLVPCNPGDITQLVLNLLVNAVHAIEDSRKSGRGRIVIAVERRDREILLQVADNGTGVDPAIADRIFEPFFTTKEPGRGTGQGLALCHRIVTERHGGRIAMRSTLGEGSIFEVTLPLDPTTITPREDAA